MKHEAIRRRFCATAFAAVAIAGGPVHAEMSAEELAKLAQNPVGNLVSVPFQNNTNLNYGPERGTQNILNIQPVIPVSVNSDWNIITRTIVPLVSMPALGPGIESLSGIGDTVLTAFLSPANPGKWIWGAGPVIQIPTNSNSELGNKNWGLAGCGNTPLESESSSSARFRFSHSAVSSDFWSRLR